MALKGFGAQVGDSVALQVLGPGERLPTSLLWTNKATVIIVFPFMTEQLGHAGERPTTTL